MWVIYSSLLLLPLVCLAQDGPIVDTIYGQVQGFVDITNTTGAEYEGYFGIPFAQPPVGDLRFAKPVPREPWEGIIDAKNFASGCIEVNNATDTDEDCLYLNVYVPGRDRAGDGLAVMVWAHGGGFFFGRGSFYPGHDLSTHGDVIVVTINYRLGALGFLSTEDEVAPGNYGLWDVKLALEWVRDNIAAFGGSPDRVTMFGQSAGAAITSHVLISPETKELVARGICVSGSSSGYFGTALPGNVASSTELLARRLDCPNDTDSEGLLQCLREQDPYDINYSGTAAVIIFKQQPPNFIPVIDGEFIPEHPADTWNNSAPFDHDLITGAAIYDGAYFVLTDLGNGTVNLAGTKATMNAVIRIVTSPYPGEFDEMRDAIYDQYPGIDENDTVIRTESFSQVMTDWFFDVGAHYEGSHHSVAGNTYMYEFAYPVSFLRDDLDDDYQWMIADHSDDLYMIWGEEFTRSEFSEGDKVMSRDMMSYYTNFANNGDPNIGLDVPVPWPQFDRESREYIQFSEETKVLTQAEEELDNYRFWVQDFPRVANP